MAKRALRPIVSGFFVLFGALSVPIAFAQGHQITVFVDEGRLSLTGHVFISLSDGVKTFHYGFYSKNKLLAIISAGGGEIRDDSAHEWDVKRVYNIDETAYQNAFEAIIAWKNHNEAWWFDHHCGDFAETVLEAAGVNLPLNWSYTGRDRPAIFGRYLREHGGIAHYPFEGDWIVDSSSDGTPAGFRISIEHFGEDGYAMGANTFHGSPPSIRATYILSLDDMRRLMPEIPYDILSQAEGLMSSTRELTLSDNGQHLDFRFTSDKLKYFIRKDAKTGAVIRYDFDSIGKGEGPSQHATFHRATPEEDVIDKIKKQIKML